MRPERPVLHRQAAAPRRRRPAGRPGRPAGGRRRPDRPTPPADGAASRTARRRPAAGSWPARPPPPARPRSTSGGTRVVRHRAEEQQGEVPALGRSLQRGAPGARAAGASARVEVGARLRRRVDGEEQPAVPGARAQPCTASPAPSRAASTRSRSTSRATPAAGCSPQLVRHLEHLRRLDQHVVVGGPERLPADQRRARRARGPAGGRAGAGRPRPPGAAAGWTERLGLRAAARTDGARRDAVLLRPVARRATGARRRRSGPRSCSSRPTGRRGTSMSVNTTKATRIWTTSIAPPPDSSR